MKRVALAFLLVGTGITGCGGSEKPPAADPPATRQSFEERGAQYERGVSKLQGELVEVNRQIADELRKITADTPDPGAELKKITASELYKSRGSLKQKLDELVMDGVKSGHPTEGSKAAELAASEKALNEERNRVFKLSAKPKP
jgi:hypothetical protein